jgi:tetratricopeptide (TPR) repeat protein
MSRPYFPYLRLLASIVALFSLTGCFGGSKQNVRPEAQVRAESLLVRAVRAEHKGDVKEAENLLRESLVVSTSIEDNSAKAMALINLARLQRLGHDPASATVDIDSALDLLRTAEAGIYAEAAQEKALIVLSTNNADAALSWAEKSVAAEKGNLLGRRLNLLGRIQLVRGDTANSTATLNKALSENHGSGNAEEEANTLRMLGIIARSGNNITEAERLLNEALEIDKRIGVSGKIAIDLEDLAATARLAGNHENEVKYLERAYEVHLNSGRTRQAIATQTTLVEVFNLLGDFDKADKARKTAQTLMDTSKIQQPGISPDTIKPSKSP